MGWMDGWDLSQTTTTTRAPLAVLTSKVATIGILEFDNDGIIGKLDT